MFLRFVLCFVLMLGLTDVSFSQGVHPEVQAQIDSLQNWIEKQISVHGSIDQNELSSWNEKIRQTQARISQEGVRSNSLNPDARERVFSGLLGTSFTVPEGKKWQVRKVTVSAGLGEYQVLVTSIRFPDIMSPGEVLRTPSFCSEGSLLAEDASSLMYTFHVLEFDP